MAKFALRSTSAAVNFPDLMSEGKYQFKAPLPFTPGLEAAGEVIELGEGVTRFKPGDRVMGFFDYGFAEEAVVEEKFNGRARRGMSWEMAGRILFWTIRRVMPLWYMSG